MSNSIEALAKGAGISDALKTQGWSLLNEQVSLPSLVLYRKHIDNNLRWMQAFADQAGVKLCPHGKTSMLPDLFNKQIEQGAWGMTLASVPQVISAVKAGIPRVILANPLVGGFNIQQIKQMLSQTDVDFYCLVDCEDNLNALSAVFDGSENTPRLQVLIEAGVDNGRCGVRNYEQAHTLAKLIADRPGLDLRGIEFYEGVIHTDNSERDIRTFINGVLGWAAEFNAEQLFSRADDIIITGAGSAWYDVVADVLTQIDLPLAITPVIRPGCYAIHDTGIYEDAQNAVTGRSAIACDLQGDLVSSMEVWAYVLSRPQEDCAIIGLGKRDAAFDAGLPTPSLHFRPGSDAPVQADASWEATNIMDQHLMLKIPADADLKVGDIISFSTSHPCLTLDKWRQVNVMDDDFTIREVMKTHF